MTHPTDLRTYGNALLDALPAITRDALAVRLKRVDLIRGVVTTRAGEPLQHVDFPVDAVMAIVAATPSGKTIEVTLAGSEGYVEADAGLDGDIAQRSALCRLPGAVWRLSIGDFRAAVAADPEFMQGIRSATRLRLFLTEQAVLCNAHHTMDHRLARWLLDARDRSGREHFNVTQAELAGVLGVRRAGISLTVARLRAAGAVTNERGGLIVTDFERLRAETCECYGVMRAAMRNVSE